MVPRSRGPLLESCDFRGSNVEVNIMLSRCEIIIP